MEPSFLSGLDGDFKHKNNPCAGPGGAIEMEVPENDTLLGGGFQAITGYCVG